MGIPTSVWFIIAAVALVLGLLMLRAAQRTGGAQPRDRRRWAQQKEWEYLDSDPVLPSRWRYGTIHQGGPGVARNLVTGSVPTAEGRRLVYVFDHEQAGRLSSVVAAVQRRSAMKGAFELRLPSAPLPDDAGLDLLEPVGQRYAFVSDAAAIRPLITPRLIRAADAIGDDVELLWGEDSWVLCTAPLDYAPDQLQDLLDQLVEVAGALEEAAKGGGAAPRARAETRTELPAAEATQAAAPPEPKPEPTAESSPGASGGSSAAAGWARSLSSRSSTVRPLRPTVTRLPNKAATEKGDDTPDGDSDDEKSRTSDAGRSTDSRS
ncbi:hypothetical protein [Pseudonocardia spinosispora]|uniref:hypothetical protein n=1 Tax=Pseudonocardia spinosispora TaxID=103441 RepID=UPI00040B9DE6|nr:hypothetical protein [Pseudonocardia spinosispora]